ncbi:MAG: diacylglycerol kinase family lipid kinase [Candidatus Omnitrophica bacterium]|nr:diacylglycerol kinase family lipid kinase [Candidatus Omnitrophota bacterium]
MNRRFYVVYNPKGGGGTAPKVLDRFTPFFKDHGFDLDLHETEHPHHGIDLIRESDLSAFDGILVVGGDGSIHDIINGLMTREDGKRLPIGILPAGTGNSFMQHLDCLDPNEAAERIAGWKPRFVDIAEVRTETQTLYAFNFIGWGTPAEINQRAERMRWLRKHRYTVAALIEILLLHKPFTQLTIEGRTEEGPFVFAMGCLVRYTGVGMKVAPLAVCDDGLIDLLLVRNAGKMELLNVFPKIFSGDHVGHPKLEYLQVKDFSISSEEPGVLNLDGEVFPDRNISVRVLPREIQILV